MREALVFVVTLKGSVVAGEPSPGRGVGRPASGKQVPLPRKTLSLTVQVSDETPHGTGIFQHADVEDIPTVFNAPAEDQPAIQRGGE